MKKSMLCMATTFVLLSSLPLQSMAVTGPDKPLTSSSKPLTTTEPDAATLRLEEINAMDKTNMTGVEKRQLRREVRSIKKQAAIKGGGVYISGAALILIIVLLIVLL